MGKRLSTITDLATSATASLKLLLTTGSLSRLIRFDTLADWIIQTYAGFVQSGIGTLTPVARTAQAKMREVKTSADFSNAPSSILGIGVNALSAITTGDINTAFGDGALQANTTGFGNTAIGYQALKANTIGGSATFGGNTAVGASAMISNTIGDNNTAIGLDALYTNTTGYSNTAVGSNALGFGSAGYLNTAIGYRALFNGGAGNTNTAVGYSCLNANLTGTNNVALGAFAGAYELGSNAFYVDNQDRGTTGNDKARALMYGTFNTDASLQTLALNARVTIAYNLTVSLAGAGSHVIGGAVLANAQLRLTGASTGSSTNAFGLYSDYTLSPTAGDSAHGWYASPTINKAGSGTHATFSGVRLDPPTIGAGAATLTNSATLYITGAPSVGTNKYTLWLGGGDIRLDTTVQSTIGANGAASALTANPVGYFAVYIGTTKCIIPYYNP